MLVAFLYGMMGLLDFPRGQIMGRVGANFQARLDRRVFEAVLRKSAIVKDDRSATGLRDLEAVQRLQTSPVLMALLDFHGPRYFCWGSSFSILGWDAWPLGAARFWW
jgi:ATP-binding cassette subfamily C protein